MTAPTWQSSGTLGNGSGTSPAVAVPSGVVAGSIIVVIMYVDGVVATVTPPAGFTAAPGIPVTAVSPFNHQNYVFWKRATGADSGTYTFTLSTSVFCEWQAHRYTGGRASGNAFDTANDGATDAASGTVTPPVSTATSEPDELLIHTGTDWASGTWTPPIGFTQRQSSTGVGLITMAEKVQATAGATGSVTATCAGNDKRSAWIGAVLGPAAATNSGSQFMPFFN